MPKIPQYNAQVSLTKEVPAIQTDASAAGQTGRSLSQVGNVIYGLGEQIEKVKINAETDKAKILGNDLINNAELESLKENYSENYDANNEARIKNIKKTVLATVKDRQAIRDVSNWLDLNLSNSHAKMKQYSYKKLIDAQRNIIDERVFEIQENILNNTYPQLKEQYLGEISSLLTQKADLGIITKGDALKSFKSIKENLPEKQIDHDSYFKPELVLSELKKKNYGKYEGLPKERVDDYIIKAESRINYLKNEGIRKAKEAVYQRESEITAMKVNGDPALTPDFVRTEMNTGKINSAYADVMINNLEKTKKYNPTPLEKITKYVELVDRKNALAKKENSWFGKASFDELTQFRADAINAETQGLITESQLTNNLISEFSESFYKKPVFQAALDSLAAQSELYITSEAQAQAKAEMYQNLMRKVIDGKEPMEAVNEVISEKIAREMEEVKKADEAEEIENRIFANKGKQRIYSDDKGTTWYDAKTNKKVK